MGGTEVHVAMLRSARSVRAEVSSDEVIDD